MCKLTDRPLKMVTLQGFPTSVCITINLSLKEIFWMFEHCANFFANRLGVVYTDGGSFQRRVIPMILTCMSSHKAPKIAENFCRKYPLKSCLDGRIYPHRNGRCIVLRECIITHQCWRLQRSMWQKKCWTFARFSFSLKNKVFSGANYRRSKLVTIKKLLFYAFGPNVVCIGLKSQTKDFFFARALVTYKLWRERYRISILMTKEHKSDSNTKNLPVWYGNSWQAHQATLESYLRFLLGCWLVILKDMAAKLWMWSADDTKTRKQNYTESLSLLNISVTKKGKKDKGAHEGLSTVVIKKNFEGR